MIDEYNVEEISDAFREIVSYLRKSSRSTMDAMGLSGPRFSMLMIIKHHQPLRVGALQEELQVAMSTVTQMADSLVASGYVQRKRSPDDRRAVLLSLTDEGDQLVRALRSKHLEPLQNALHVFNHSERDNLLKNLQKISHSMKKNPTNTKEPIHG